MGPQACSICTPLSEVSDHTIPNCAERVLLNSAVEAEKLSQVLLKTSTNCNVLGHGEEELPPEEKDYFLLACLARTCNAMMSSVGGSLLYHVSHQLLLGSKLCLWLILSTTSLILCLFAVPLDLLFTSKQSIFKAKSARERLMLQSVSFEFSTTQLSTKKWIAGLQMGYLGHRLWSPSRLCFPDLLWAEMQASRNLRAFRRARGERKPPLRY